MSKLTAKWLRPGKTGRAIYTVSGPAAELEAYKAAQGSYLREDNGQPLIFADAPIDRRKSHTVIFSAELNRYFVDFSEVAAAAGAIATAEKRGGNRLADRIADLEAQELRGTSMASSSAISTVTGATEVASVEADLTDVSEIPAGKKPEQK